MKKQEVQLRKKLTVMRLKWEEPDLSKPDREARANELNKEQQDQVSIPLLTI